MKYLFYLAKAYSISIVAPMVEYLAELHQDYAFYISDNVAQAFPSEWDKTRVLPDLQAARHYHPDFVLAPGNFVDFRIPGVKVQVFHGLGVEKPVHFTIRHFFDVYLTSGKYVTDRFTELQKKYKYFEVLETGWLKLDYILNYPQQKIAAIQGLPTGKKLILYAPTFSSRMQSATELLSSLPSIMREDEYWLLKFHELMPPEQIEPFRLLSSSAARIITKEEITPYLHLSDLMISDTSSVVYEFLALNKPVITYRTLARENKAYNITDAKELRSAIDISLSYPVHLRQRRDQAMSEVNPYLDGKTAQRVVTALESLNPRDFPKRHKPLNLFRKWQVIYHSLYRKGYLR
jgi:CDP-glycerol glycerophosphotransferase (TagB/SpsB family)